ncbi:mutator type transposase, partial [Tanacetum coccineum]
NHPTAFTLKINHGGQLTCPPNVRYIGGKSNWFDDVDADTFSTIEVQTMITLVSNEDIDNEFDPLFSYPDNNTYKDRPGGSNVGKSPSGSNDGKRPSVIEDVDGSDSSAASEDSEDSDDSEFDVGDEDRIEDVEVDMDDFRKHTDENVEWVECNEEEVQVPPPFDYEEVDLEDFGSGTESDDLECERKRALKKLAKAHRPVDGQMYTENFYVGQSLANKQLIKEMVSKLSVAQRRQLWFTRNDKTRMRAECRGLVPVFGNGPGDSGLGVGDGGPVCDKPKVDSRCDKKTKKKDPVGDSIKCPWLLHCSKSKKAETWWVKKFNDSHTCLQSRSIGKCTASFLSEEIKETIKPNPMVPISALKDQLQRKYELGMSDMKIFRAKQMVEERVIGDWVKQYAQLRQYALELKEKNPETTIKIDVERCFDVESETRQFKRIYICLGALKNGFKAGPHRDKCVVNIILRSCACRKWEITGMPCKHAVACIWDMANSGLEHGIPESWVHESYWLKTWEEMYSYNGGGKNNTKDPLWRSALTTTVHMRFRNKEYGHTSLEGQRSHGYGSWTVLEMTWSCSETPTSPSYQIGKRKWEITGMPCKHAVASIWHMANNGLEPGIPESWVHESYWLKTWVDMYRFKVNPCNGPELWPESDTPITLTALITNLQ